MTTRPCIECGKLHNNPTRCPTCQKLHNQQRERNRNKRDRTKYSGDYARRAKHIRETAQQCWICGQGPRPNDPWQADHLDPSNPASELAAAHRTCNIRRAHQERAQQKNTQTTNQT